MVRFSPGAVSSLLVSSSTVALLHVQDVVSARSGGTSSSGKSATNTANTATTESSYAGVDDVVASGHKSRKWWLAAAGGATRMLALDDDLKNSNHHHHNNNNRNNNQMNDDRKRQMMLRQKRRRAAASSFRKNKAAAAAEPRFLFQQQKSMEKEETAQEKGGPAAADGHGHGRGPLKNQQKTVKEESTPPAFRPPARNIEHNSRVVAPRECDPDPDIGILNCPMLNQGPGPKNEYYFEHFVCQAHVESSLGGFCVHSSTIPQGKGKQEGDPGTSAKQHQEQEHTRRLQKEDGSYYYSPGYFSFGEYACGSSNSYYDSAYISCDCSGFDLTTKTGEVTCELQEPYCRQYGCSVPVCSTFSIVYTSTLVSGADDASSTATTATTLEYCANFSEPYPQIFCQTYYREVGGPDYIGGECTITVDGEQCPMCMQESDGCVIFDCQDLGAGSNLDGCPSYYYPTPAPGYSGGGYGGGFAGTNNNNNIYYSSSTYSPYNYNNNSYNFPRAPILATYCNGYGGGGYYPPPFVPIVGECSLCPLEGTGITPSTSTIGLNFPFVAVTADDEDENLITCGYVESMADQGRIYGIACDYVTSFTSQYCCEDDEVDETDEEVGEEEPTGGDDGEGSRRS